MSRIEEIRSAAQAYYPSGTNHEEIKVASFIRGARYGDKTMIKKAWDWFYNMALDYVSGDITDVKWESMFADFRKYVENGDN